MMFAHHPLLFHGESQRHLISFFPFSVKDEIGFRLYARLRFTIHRDLRLLAPRGYTQVKIFLNSSGRHGYLHCFRFRIVACHLEREIITNIIGGEVLIDIEIAFVLCIQE